MKNVINVLVVDNEKSIKMIKEYFSSNQVVSIKYEATDGLKALNIIKEYHKDIDVIVLDTILPLLDGFGILKYMKQENINCKTIVHSNFNNTSFITSLSIYDISFFLYKNIDLKILEERIIDSVNIPINNEISNNQALKKGLSKLLHDLGMPSHIKGYQYIRDSIELMYNNSEHLGGITKEVYPYIAEKYNTTASRVERAIRHAIEVSWTRGDYDLMEEIFGHSVDFDRAKPTNSEFLATITDKLAMDNKVKLP